MALKKPSPLSPSSDCRRRSRRRVGHLLVGLGLVLLAPTLPAAAPGWLAIEARQAPPVARDEAVEVLRRDLTFVLTEDGRWERHTRQVLRINRPSPKSPPFVAEPYVQGTDEIERAEAWLWRGGQTVQSFSKREWFDRAEDDGSTLYSDFRALVIAVPTAAAGDFLGAETATRATLSSGQEIVDFRSPTPVREWRVEVRIPKGWNLEYVWLRQKGPTPEISPDRSLFTWAIHDLPAEKTETWAGSGTVPRLGLSISPRAGSRPAPAPTPRSWGDVAASLYRLQDPQCDRNATLAQEAASALGGAATPADKIAALNLLVRKLRYIEVVRNDGLGFGYRPHRATEVLAADYGDCKDKSNLLKAFLREAGLRSHLVAVNVGDPEDISPAWPSAAQFNHAIVAVELPSGTSWPNAVNVPGFGPLLFVDPTARWTPAGHLPWQIQGSRALICDPRTTDLVSLPVEAGGEAFRLQEVTQLSADKEDHWSGETVETAHGDLAAELEATDAIAPNRLVRSRWDESVGSLLVDPDEVDISGRDSDDGWSTSRTIRFKARAVGKVMGGDWRLLNFNFDWGTLLSALPDRPRQHPLLVPPLEITMDTTVKLPATWSADLPAKLDRTEPFGHFERSFAMRDGQLICHRAVFVTTARIPPEKYADFRHFLAEVANAERASVIVHMTGP